MKCRHFQGDDVRIKGIPHSVDTLARNLFGMIQTIRSRWHSLYSSGTRPGGNQDKTNRPGPMASCRTGVPHGFADSELVVPSAIGPSEPAGDHRVKRILKLTRRVANTKVHLPNSLEQMPDILTYAVPVRECTVR